VLLLGFEISVSYLTPFVLPCKALCVAHLLENSSKVELLSHFETCYYPLPFAHLGCGHFKLINDLFLKGTPSHVDLTGEQITQRRGDSRSTVQLSQTPENRGYWEEIKGSGCKYYRNTVTKSYLGKSGNSFSLWRIKKKKDVKNVVFIKMEQK